MEQDRPTTTLYLDEDVSVLIADIVESRGFEATTARDEEMIVALHNDRYVVRGRH
jgi:hypothetical protein